MGIEKPGVAANQIEREIVIDAPVSRVWAALTEAEHLGAWFGDDGAEVELYPGGAVVLRWKEHGVFHSRIERIDPMRSLSMRGSYLPDEEPRPGNSTVVEFTLTPEGDGTHLRVVESGFDELDLTEEQRAQYRAGNIEGWRSKLAEFAAYLQREMA
jgi:uncharacterized protein YndB with AHSA1/START domain